MLIAIVRSLRPPQWTKNGLVFAPLIFSGLFRDPGNYPAVILTFCSFCLVSGAVYLVNDILDAESDRVHPEKMNRPIATGQLPIRVAAIAAVACLLCGILLAFSRNWETGVTALSYACLAISYSVALKHVLLVDVMAIAGGFVLRAVAGAVCIPVDISPWLIICTVLLSSFLAFNKRRHELLLLGEEAALHRANLARYSPRMLNTLIGAITGATILSYALYTVSKRTIEVVGTSHLVFTLPFVIYGIGRYLFLVNTRHDCGDPSATLLRDWQLLATVVLWFAAVCLIIWMSHGDLNNPILPPLLVQP